MMQWRDLKHSYESRLTALAKQSPYELLDVSSSASPAEVRKAYLRKVKAYHPDSVDPFIRSYGEEVVKLLNRAYERLCKEPKDNG